MIWIIKCIRDKRSKGRRNSQLFTNMGYNIQKSVHNMVDFFFQLSMFLLVMQNRKQNTSSLSNRDLEVPTTCLKISCRFSSPSTHKINKEMFATNFKHRKMRWNMKWRYCEKTHTYIEKRVNIPTGWSRSPRAGHGNCSSQQLGVSHQVTI